MAVGVADELRREDVGKYDRLPVKEVIRLRGGREGSAISRREVLEQFDARPGGCAQRCDAQVGALDVVEVGLFVAVVLAAAGGA